jgi:hypothetical protein
MKTKLLKQCPHDVAKQQLYERFNSHAGPFTQIFQLPGTSEVYLLFGESDFVERKAWLTGAFTSAIYCATTSLGDAYVLFDTIYNHQDTIYNYEDTGVDHCINIVVTSNSQETTWEIVELIEILSQYENRIAEQWLHENGEASNE